MAVLDHLVGAVPDRTGAGEDRNAIDERAARPVDDFLANAPQARPLTVLLEQAGAHAQRARAVVDKNSPLNQETLAPAEAFPERRMNFRSVGAVVRGRRSRARPAHFQEREIKSVTRRVGVMNETGSVLGELARQLPNIRFQNVRLRMHQRIEAEHEIDRLIFHHVQRFAVVDKIADVIRGREAPPAMIDAPGAEIDDGEPLAEILQKARPTSVARRDFQNGFARDKGVDARQQGAPPLGFRPAPGQRPFLALLRPVVFAVPTLDVFLDRGHDAPLLTPRRAR